MERSVRPAPSGRPRLPRSAAEIAETYAGFRNMREALPVARDERHGLSQWHVFGYDDVATALADNARFSSRHALLRGTLLSDTLVAKDPPDHRKLRNLVNLAFTPKAVASLSTKVQEVTQELIDRVRAKGEMDIVSDLAFPLPARVIAELLGVPRQDWDIFRRWAAMDAAGSAREGDDFLIRARDEIHAYFIGLLEQRRREPRDDLLTALSRAEIDSERLSERDLVNFCLLLLLAGQETTKNLIANFFLTLSEHPEAHDALLRQPALMATAVEEVLRYLPPVWVLMRRTTTAVELSGVEIPAGELVVLWLASANRDRTRFPDPDRLDIRRDPNRHLSFGQGIHFCVGAPLTRLEANVALPMVLEQLRDLRVVRRDPITISTGVVFVIDRLLATFAA